MERIVLGRVGFEDGDLVNLTAFNQSGTPYSRTSVPVEVAPKIEDRSNSFHLNRDCPWSR